MKRETVLARGEIDVVLGKKKRVGCREERQNVVEGKNPQEVNLEKSREGKQRTGLGERKRGRESGVLFSRRKRVFRGGGGPQATAASH